MSPTTIHLAARLDSAEADKLRAALLGERGRAVTLEAGSVERIGALSAQVILSAEMTWRDDGADFSVSSASQALLAGLADLGLNSLLPVDGDRR